MVSRSNYDKPFYVDVGTSVAAIRCASDGDVIDGMDHHGKKDVIKVVEDKCASMNRECELYALCRMLKDGDNEAAMREALEALIAYWDWNGFDAVRESQLKDMARAALAAPTRNCEVGTAEEQVKRFMRFCDSKVCNRRDCACGYEELFRHKCAIRWEQMPYEEKEGGAK